MACTFFEARWFCTVAKAALAVPWVASLLTPNALVTQNVRAQIAFMNFAAQRTTRMAAPPASTKQPTVIYGSILTLGYSD